MADNVMASTPAARLFRFTRFHASHRTSRLLMRSYSAWNRRPGCRLATSPSRCCGVSLRRRAHARRVVGPALAGHALSYNLGLTITGTFAPVALLVAAIVTTTVPSDSRCAALAFAFGLYEPPVPDLGCADGSLLLRLEPCTRAAPSTPEIPDTRLCQEPGASNVAFAPTCSTRLSHCFCNEAAGSTSCCRPRACSPTLGSRRPSGSRPPARDTSISAGAWGLLPGAPTLTGMGLAPAGSTRRERSAIARAGDSRSSGRTMIVRICQIERAPVRSR